MFCLRIRRGQIAVGVQTARRDVECHAEADQTTKYLEIGEMMIVNAPLATAFAA